MVDFSGAVDAAKGFACGLYRDFPAAFLGADALAIPGYTPAVRAFWDGLCSDDPDYSPPPSETAPPFNGGQCRQRAYLVSIKAPDRDPFTGVQGPDYENTAAVWGPILGARLTGAAIDPFDQKVGFRAIQVLCHSDPSSGVYVESPQWLSFGGGSGNSFQSVSIENVVPVDGLPDTCGDPLPVTVPDNPDREIPPERTVDDSPPISLPGLPVPVPYPIILRPQIDVNIPISVRVGPIDIDFNFDGPTIVFNPPGPGTVPPLPPPTYPPGTPPLPPSPDEPMQCPDPCPEVDLSPVIDKLDELLSRQPPDEVDLERIEALLKTLVNWADPPTFPGRSLLSYSIPNTDSGVAVLPPNTLLVRLTLLGDSSRWKTQSGNADSPLVIFGGWYAFGDETFGGDRRPISYRFNVFYPSRNDSAMTWCITGNGRADIEVFYWSTPPIPE